MTLRATISLWTCLIVDSWCEGGITFSCWRSMWRWYPRGIRPCTLGYPEGSHEMPKAKRQRIPRLKMICTTTLWATKGGGTVGSIGEAPLLALGWLLPFVRNMSPQDRGRLACHHCGRASYRLVLLPWWTSACPTGLRGYSGSNHQVRLCRAAWQRD